MGMRTTAPDIDDVPALHNIATAIQHAREVDCSENDLIVGVCDANGRVMAATTLRCFDQVSALHQTMESFGYRWMILAEQDMQGCDLLYLRQMH